jgi:hypothetical protein|tara:strand:+ start:6552 stop:6791 length:240 start_codon:yes stop_codon:yes gene_type:complete
MKEFLIFIGAVIVYPILYVIVYINFYYNKKSERNLFKALCKKHGHNWVLYYVEYKDHQKNIRKCMRCSKTITFKSEKNG